MRFRASCRQADAHHGRACAQVAFGAEFLRTRIEKERKAVLAEAQMMNTIEYRMDCQLLQYLHEEHALGHRFPIGMVDQARRPRAPLFARNWSFGCSLASRAMLRAASVAVWLDRCGWRERYN